MAARRYEIFLLVLKNISLLRWFFNTRREFRIFKRPCNVLFIIFTPMKCQTISLEYFLLPKGAIYYVPIGGGHWGYPVPQYREKLANTEIPCQKWMKY